MKKIIKLVPGVLALLVAGGCDWTSGGGVDSWSSRYNWVNFSGVYRGIGGGVLVTDFTATPGTDGETRTASGERIATGTAANTSYGGTLNNRSVVPGSVTINAGQFSLSDQGDGTLSGGPGTSGTIEYGSGGWSIDLQSSPGAGTPITATYQYDIEGTDGAPAGSGASGRAIRSFTVHQEGETLRITDNNGALYRGNMGSVRSTGGGESAGSLVEGETVVAQFSVSGTSSAGVEVRITGTFQGVVGGVSAAGDSASLGNRQMFGTWIEPSGRTGDINAQASPLRINTDTGGN